MIQFHGQGNLRKKLLLTILLLENGCRLNNLGGPQQPPILHLDLADTAIGALANFLNKHIILQIAFLLDFSEGIPLNGDLAYGPLDTTIVILVVEDFYGLGRGWDGY